MIDNSLNEEQLVQVVFICILVCAFYTFFYETIMTIMSGRIIRKRDKEIKHLFEE